MIEDEIIKTITSIVSLCLEDLIIFDLLVRGFWVYFHSFFCRSCARILIIHFENFLLIRRGTGFETVDINFDILITL